MSETIIFAKIKRHQTLTKLIKQFFILFTVLSPFSIFAQDEYVPPENDLDLQESYKMDLKMNVRLMRRETSGIYSSEIDRLYKSKYKSSIHLANYNHFFFHEDWNNYLSNVTYKIASNNEDYDFSRIRPVMSSYFWANAFSIGEGTVVINPGIIPYLENEDQLAFILCHEFAHYILKHFERKVITLLQDLHSEEFEKEITDIAESEYYHTTQLKKLLRSKLYETRQHSRSLEIEADSLGLILFRNAGFELKEALTTLQILDQISGKHNYDIDISEITNIPPVHYKTSDLLGNASNTDTWLDLDSIKTHPDCSHRFYLMSAKIGITDSFESFKTTYDPTTSFLGFQRELTYFIIECYLQYDRIDLALLTIWNHQKSGDDNEYLKKTSFIALSDMVYARKIHNIGHVFSFPNDSMGKAHYDLSSMIFGMRYKDFVNTFYDLAMESYDESFDGEEYLYALIKLEYCKGDKDALADYKAEYLSRFDHISGKYYKEIKYLH
ncbi:MAG: hypothetical protein ACI9JN_002256 [Bacteroidia bacterium]